MAGLLLQGLGPKCHFFSTFFINKLYKDTGYCYKDVSARGEGTGTAACTLAVAARFHNRHVAVVGLPPGRANPA